MLKGMKDSEKWKVVGIHIMLYAFLLLFFIRICPMIPYDQDDWIYLGQMRIPLPLWGDWNPVKVLPEVLMPMCGYISAYVVYPIVGDYLYSITIMAGIIVSSFVCLLCFCVMKFLKTRIHVSVNMALVFEILFLILNFAIFRNRGTSRYMFYADNMNCVFNYTIPGIVNAIAVLIMMQRRNFQEVYDNYSNGKKGLFILIIYVAIFSNIFHSEMTAIYCGTILLLDLLEEIKKKIFELKNYVKNHRIYLSILVIWCVSIIFEMNGARAARVSNDASLSFETSFRQLFALIQALADPFMILAVACIMWSIFHIGKKWYSKLQMEV